MSSRFFRPGGRGLLETVNSGFDHHNRLLGRRRVAELGEALEQSGLRGDDWQDGHGWALMAALGSGAWRVGDFERGEVVRAGDTGVGLGELKNAAVIHFGGMGPEDKRRLAFAFHAMAVYGDEDGLFLDMMES